jgi:hypothetical protein
MKPTEGEWKAEREEEFRFEITSQDDVHIATLDWPWSGEDPEFRELEANANLIAEAGTVYHETGLTPREILAQRDELLAAIKIAEECDNPEKVTLYDEDGVEGWRWTHYDGTEWTECGDWHEPPPTHPVITEAIEKIQPA